MNKGKGKGKNYIKKCKNALNLKKLKQCNLSKFVRTLTFPYLSFLTILGEGKSKKEAKLACSQSAILTLFGQSIKPEGIFLIFSIPSVSPSSE